MTRRSVQVSLSEEEYQALQAWAGQEFRTMAQQAHYCVRQALMSAAALPATVTVIGTTTGGESVYGNVAMTPFD